MHGVPLGCLILALPYFTYLELAELREDWRLEWLLTSDGEKWRRGRDDMASE